MHKYLLVGILLLVVSVSVHAQKIRISAAPSWVESPTLEVDKNREVQVGEGYRYLRFEKQINLQQREVFNRYSVQVLTVEGIGENSDIQIDYDPTFQELEVHEVSIYRNGKKINKLNPDEFKIIQKEASADRHIYDGALSALLHLSDVQKNDIIDYSYSVKGFNPVYGNQFSGFLYHQLFVKVEAFNYRILVPQGQSLQIQDNGHIHKPEKLSQGGLDIYEWNHDGLKQIIADNNVPYWSPIYPITSYSTFSDWKSVVDWAAPFYRYSDNGLAEIKKQLPQNQNKQTRITNIIRYVQDEIRYLGLEAGMSAYRPNSPQKVHKQKFGDCKDKSLLLVSLLQSEGIEAYPVLVNTELKNNIDAYTANASAFDHCVVTYNWKDKDYFVDPTISDQGGSLTNIYFPDYGKGLILKLGNRTLTTFPSPEKPVQKVEELFIVEDLEGDANLQIKTEYRGSKADEIRSSFANSTTDEISRTYLNFYADMYPEITLKNEIEFEDSERNGANVIITIERYRITNFWQKSDTDDSQIIVEIYPLELNSRINFPRTAGRDMDYYVGVPEEFSLTTKLVMPEYWPVEESKKRIDGGAFVYENEITGDKNTIKIFHKLDILKPSISAKEVSELLKMKDRVAEELTFYLTYSPNGGLNTISWPAVLVALLLLFASFFFGKKLYTNYNPEPQGASLHDGIGGWLIIPSITLIVIPIMIIYNLIEGAYFYNSVWAGAEVHGNGLLLFLGVSFLFMLCLFGYAVITFIFFFKLRTAAPQMYIILITINFIGSFLEAYVLSQFFHDLDDGTASQGLFRGVLGLIIWIPYFVKSQRVKTTFTRTYQEKEFVQVS